MQWKTFSVHQEKPENSRILEEGRRDMALQKPIKGTARIKLNKWCRGNGSYSARGELRAGISRNKKILNRKVRRKSKVLLQNSNYKKVCRSGMMVDFS